MKLKYERRQLYGVSGAPLNGPLIVQLKKFMTSEESASKGAAEADG